MTSKCYKGENSQINKNPSSHQPLKDKVAIVGNHYKLITQTRGHVTTNLSNWTRKFATF